MPAPKRIAADQRFSQIDEISRANGETNDCSVKALSLALDVPYEKAHAALASEGRKHCRGTHVPAIRAAFAKLGGEFITVDPADFINRYPGAHKNLKSVTTHHPDRFNKVWADGNTYLIFVTGHVLVVRNGVNLDWTRGRAKRAYMIWKVTNA